MPAVALVAAVVALGLAVAGSSAEPPVIPAKVIRTFPHDRNAFCQGLVFHNGQLLEGTGQLGESSLRVLDLQTGMPSWEHRLRNDEFGEGITVLGNRLYQLTWRNGYLIEYDAATLKPIRTVSYRDIDRSLREGWGITHDGTSLIVSDGSSKLRFIDPQTFRLIRTAIVRSGRKPISKLNELEFVEGEVLANIWYEDSIVRLNPQSGEVTGWLDCRQIRPAEVRGFRHREDVLNGIAWDSQNRRLLVTGKNWPSMFEVEFP
ncbi:MAG: glutaminyl-peptide cyclotransferase [Planctomycetaceae bacterium]|nr:glutaminyl-peptide cyclotransferase [Planctomycetaceae bacterium]